MQQLKCPACGGSVIFEEGNDILFCTYCGAKMQLKKGPLDKIIQHREHSQQFAEEVRQRKVQEGIQAEVRTEKKERKSLLIGLLICLLCFLLIGVVVFFGIRGENNTEAELKAIVAEIQDDIASGNDDVALVKAESLHWTHGDTVGIKRWDEQREALVKIIKDAKRDSNR